MGSYKGMFGLVLSLGLGVSLTACSSADDTGEAPLNAEYLGEVVGEGAPLADEVLVGFDSYAVDAEGLVLKSSASGRAIFFEFGALQSDIEPNFAENLGLTSFPTSNDECGAGAMTFANFDGVGLNYIDGIFVGWGLVLSDGDAPNATTLDGITFGTTRAEIEAVRALQEMTDSTIGHEFTAEGISMLLSGTGPDASVTAMWAGTNCIFR